MGANAEDDAARRANASDRDFIMMDRLLYIVIVVVNRMCRLMVARIYEMCDMKSIMEF